MTFEPRTAFTTLLVILLAAAPAAAFQEPAGKDDKGKAREARQKMGLAMVDEIIKDAQSLRLPENRFRVLVQTANAVWNIDERRARILFKGAQESLKELQAAVDNSDPQYAYMPGLVMQLRTEMIYTLAQRDPELALDALQATRQMGVGLAPDVAASFDAQMEMQLARLLAAKDVPRALEMAERGLAGGVSQEVVNVINALAETNRDAAQKLFDETLVRLHTENYATNPTAAYVALNLLREWFQRGSASDAAGEQQGTPTIQRLKFNEMAARDLCDTILRAVLYNPAGASPGGRLPWGNTYDMLRQLQPMLPDIKKLVPSQASSLEARIGEMQRVAELQSGPWAKVQELINTAPVSELLAAAGNAPPDVQNHLIQSAAWKAFNEGNSDLARQIIQEKLTDPRVRQDMQANIDRQSTDRLINEGKVAEARSLLSRLSSAAERVAFLTRLAALAIAKGDKNEAHQLLNEAQAQVSSRPENYQMLYAQFEIANVCRSLDPPRGYSIIEAAIDRLNELTAAAATLNGFDLQQYFRNDEFILANGNSLNQLLQQIGAQVSEVAARDADRARLMADRVGHLEMKTWIYLVMFPAVLSDNEESKTQSVHRPPRVIFQPPPLMLNGFRRSGLR
jgi:hypothetical protein